MYCLQTIFLQWAIPWVDDNFRYASIIGIFPAYLKKRFPGSDIEGIEYLDSLLNKALTDFPEISFSKGNVLDKKSVTKKFDVITMLGVLTIFDDYNTVLKKNLTMYN